MPRTGALSDTWEKLFSERNIKSDLDNKGFHIINASELKEYMEARLLTKVDNLEVLPKILEDNDCAPLSISSQAYALLRPASIIFHHLEDLPQIPNFISTRSLSGLYLTIPWESEFTTEPQAIDTAYLTGMIGNFVQDESIVLTIRGHRTLKEEFPLRFSQCDYPIIAKGVQMEIDSGYESKNGVYLLEAKIGLPENFNLRQLFYPYYYWYSFFNTVSNKKPIHSLFLAYSNRSFYLFHYEFDNPYIFDSIRLLNSSWYVLEDSRISRKYTLKVMQISNKVNDLKHIPFPQADNFARVLDIVEKIDRSEEIDVISDDVTEWYDFTSRQSFYYADAAQWLGWLEHENGVWKTTDAGKKMANANLISKIKYSIHAMITRPVTREAVEFMIQYQDVPEREQIENWIKNALQCGRITEMTENTISRRAQTIRSWLKYLNEFFED